MLVILVELEAQFRRTMVPGSSCNPISEITSGKWMGGMTQVV
jgi:hypothetical protein